MPTVTLTVAQDSQSLLITTSTGRIVSVEGAVDDRYLEMFRADLESRGFSVEVRSFADAVVELLAGAADGAPVVEGFSVLTINGLRAAFASSPATRWLTPTELLEALGQFDVEDTEDGLRVTAPSGSELVKLVLPLRVFIPNEEGAARA